jgi:hypothetical protein
MLTKSTSLCLVVALITTLCCRSAFAQVSSLTTNELSRPIDSATVSTARNDSESNERLKASFATLLSDARAGKIAPAAKSQIQPAQSNNLSKKTKILIVVGVAVALVITAIVVYKSFEYECKARCVL